MINFKKRENNFFKKEIEREKWLEQLQFQEEKLKY